MIALVLCAMVQSPSIDWGFIGAQEGGQRLQAYVPAGAARRSGVTVSTGVDLGQRAAADIQRLALSDALKAKLMPYALKRGDAARAFLRAHPLTLTREEADALDRAVRVALVLSLRRSYDRAKREFRGFDELPAAARTVIASVATQYGPRLDRATPRFWRRVIEEDWAGAVAELESFGDQYQARRRSEADLLRRSL